MYASVSRNTQRAQVNQRFTSHITLGRNKSPGMIKISQSLVPRLLFEVKEMVLYKSDLLPHGVEYTVVSTHTFKRA